MSRIIIGIQARSTSERFPGKVSCEIEGKPVLEHLMETAESSIQNLLNHRAGVNFAKAVVLIPFKDALFERYAGRGVTLFEGDEKDVLSRYFEMSKVYPADYYVRLTSDCPELPDTLLTRHIHVAIKNKYDYLANVDPAFRSAPDGHDCEVLSHRALTWLQETATEAYDREHVTPLLRTKPPEWLKRGHIMGYLDLSHVKISVDTPEDLAHVREEHRKIGKKLKEAKEHYGRYHVHRYG